MTASSQFLRRAFVADALASGATGVLLAFGGATLESLTGLQVALTEPAGYFLIAYAAFVGFLGVRSTLPGAVVWLVIVGNAIWAIESLMLLALGWAQPTPLGYAFVIGQALAVAAFAELQFMGLRRSQRLAV
ncbi:MAG: hypothetical protein Q8Q88_00165 [Phenylobacterium sp.]|uniref:hypothetical protein n=1 Tax=Phenylobacterium sp. TaxID=1871053 RepID=UPI0027371B9A|nr:hypothetical protein [Phenylobacterium sp.]MDP3745436.1 hypothetical protein [Phenylobacterium sp.]